MDIFIQNVGLSIVLQLSFYSAVRCYRPIRETPKRAAWVLTLLTAWLIAPCSFPYVRDYVWNWDEAANFTADPLSRFLVTFFLTFLVMDIVCCQLHYKNEMGFVEGWFHHSCYLGFFGWLLYEGWTVGILTAMPLEVPTVVLATGRVFPGLLLTCFGKTSSLASSSLGSCTTLSYFTAGTTWFLPQQGCGPTQPSFCCSTSIGSTDG